ncbi:hypothetical protein [Microbacterium sp. TNHR37B]|uniref:hypothetical protein n=1 Tax=Microbacterium sp. TNHR37B TaxID=1775956 RepID=UPI0007B261E5|nr:hypothetical protein [Microbacterium sp. TNHR37B]KZE89101.1 hypothetical protein AVP41_01892 [Microbacterium sp. TNHR37B]
MSESDRAFIATVAQVIPVLLLTLVVEARLFKFTRADALPGVPQARKELRAAMSKFDYWGWRTFVGIRRQGVLLTVAIVLATGLVVGMVACLNLLSQDVAPPMAGKTWLILIVSAAVTFLALGPLFGQIVSRNVHLSELEMEVTQALTAEREREAAVANADVKAQQIWRGWRFWRRGR